MSILRGDERNGKGSPRLGNVPVVLRSGVWMDFFNRSGGTDFSAMIPLCHILGVIFGAQAIVNT